MMTPDKPFKTNEMEWIFFLLMNLIAPPFGLIVGAIILGWWGFGGSLVLFYIFYRIWKYVGKYEDGILVFNPTFNFGKRQWKMFNKK